MWRFEAPSTGPLRALTERRREVGSGQERNKRKKKKLKCLLLFFTGYQTTARQAVLLNWGCVCVRVRVGVCLSVCEREFFSAIPFATVNLSLPLFPINDQDTAVGSKEAELEEKEIKTLWVGKIMFHVPVLIIIEHNKTDALHQLK